MRKKKEETEVSLEETIIEDYSPGKNASKWKNFSYYLFLALAFLLPFWAVPVAGFGLSASKSLLTFVFVLLAAVFYLVHILQKGKIRYPGSVAFWAIGAALFITLLSTIFSVSFGSSMFGAGVGTFSSLVILSIAFFLVATLFQSEKYVLNFFFLFIVSSLIVFVAQVFRSIFGISFWGLLPNTTDSLVGSWNELSIFFGFIALLSVIVLEFFGEKLAEIESGRKWRIFLFFILGVSLLVMVFVNFVSAWVVLGLLLLIFLVYLFSAFGVKRSFVRLPFFVILIALFFILARPLVGDVVSSLGFGVYDVRPSWGATFAVVKDTLGDGAKNTILGSGPNTFVYDWVKFKPAEINQTIFWNVRFQNGIGLLPTFLATTGVLSVIAWLVFLGFVVFYGLKTVGYSENSMTKGLLFGSFLGSVYLWIFSIIYVPGNLLLSLTFLVTGLFFAMLVKTGFLEMKEFSFEKKASTGFISSLTVVVLILVGVSSFYTVFQKNFASYSYIQGLKAFNIEGNLDKAEKSFLRAARFDKKDVYYRTLTELGMVRLSLLLQQTNMPQEEARTVFQNTLATTIQNAKTAASLNKNDPRNWMMLGNVYREIIPFNIEGAREAALDAYAKVLEIAPTDPSPFLSAAQLELQAKNIDVAKNYLNSALTLKGNYTDALFLLSQIAAQEGDLENAIRQTEIARLTAPNDVGILFQLGMLYYQNKDLASAQSVFERLVSVSPSYSNARYFLGLIYEKNDNIKGAIEQFKTIESLNPDNEEIKTILSNLNKGRSALSNISPPQPAPEERDEAPIDEDEEE